MRMLALPIALALGALLYTNLPQTEEKLAAALRALLAKIRQRFTSKNGKTDDRSALIVYFLSLAAAATILCAIHPLAAALLAAPLFSGFSPIPAAAATKQELDSGKFSKNIPEYERRVRAACAPLGEAFALRVITPMILCLLGMALHLGCALGWLYTGLCAVREEVPSGEKTLSLAARIGEGALGIMLFLCSGLVGRNPLNVGGTDSGEKLMHLLSLEGESDHAPISGDITQAIFLCSLCTGILCLVLSGLSFLIL